MFDFDILQLICDQDCVLSNAIIEDFGLLLMGAPKQKWTAEEESALKAGVRKHGAGKWRTILKDPEFSGTLCLRSNVDLKVKFLVHCLIRQNLLFFFGFFAVKYLKIASSVM